VGYPSQDSVTTVGIFKFFSSPIPFDEPTFCFSGCSGDAYNLSFLILQQALVGPFPNDAFMSFLKHSISAQTVSYASVLEAIVCYGTNGHLPQESKMKIKNCLKTLIYKSVYR